MRTPLTYYGGKQRLAAQIVPLMPAHRVYLEVIVRQVSRPDLVAGQGPPCR